MAARKPHIMIVESRFYEDLADMLARGALAALEQAGASYKRFTVPGALEVPGAIKIAAEHGGFDGYVALGCVLRGETSHYDIVSHESARGLMDLTVRDGLAIGNGILTCESHTQAVERADPARGNKGGDAALAALALLKLKEEIQA